MTYTLNGIDLKEARREGSRVKSDLEKVKYPFSPTKEVENYDYQGVDNTITIRGRATFDTKANLMDNFVVPIKALQNGDQQPIVLHSDLWDASTTGDYTDGNIFVKVESLEWEHVEGVTVSITYTLILFEGQ